LSAATTLSSAAPTQIGSDAPAINFRIFWDGDLLSEVLDTNKITKWAYPGMPSGGFSSATLAGIYGARNAAPLYGDMFGDWREEVLLEQSDSASMRIYSTAIPTQKRIYTLVHDPEYRNSMCEKGYIQSHMLDYYLGDGMTDPPKPNIKYPDGSGAAGSGGGGTTGAAGAGGGGGSTGGAGAVGGATSGSAGANGGGAMSDSGGAIGGGATVLGGTTGSGGGGSSGGAVATGGGISGSAGKTGTAGTPATGGGGTGAIATGGTPTPGGTPAAGGAAGGNPVTAGNTVASNGGTVTIATTAGAAGTVAATSAGAAGASAGHSGSVAENVAAGSGCSCAIGAASGRDSAGALFAMLGLLGLVVHRRRRRVSRGK
jgi:MYXO-CTERM domain-containing protein